MEDINIADLLNQVDSKTIKNGNKKPVTAGKVFACIGIGLGFSLLIFLLVGILYTNYIRFPSQEEIIPEQTGMYALEQYEDLVHSQKKQGKDDYLVKEITYANSNKSKLAFIKKIVGSVQYEPKEINAKNIFGNDMIDKETMEVVRISSPVIEGEEVFFTYVNYDSILFDEDKLSKLISEYDLTKDNVNYANVLVDMFCDYVSDLETVPKKTISRAPFIQQDGDVYVVLDKEDEYLDKLLFSSDDFRNCMMRFTEAVGKLVTEGSFAPSKDWEEWNALSDVKKEDSVEPLKYGKMTISMNWCGAYYLQNDYYSYDENGNRIKENVTPQLGDGTFESPASEGTSIITYVISKDSKGEVQKDPIRVELIEFGVSEDAINWFQSKHIQNRGYTLESEVQYCYYVFRITNLSNKTLTVNDNSSLCDKSGNLSTRTGTVYGLSESITLKPDESGIIESWGRSTELYRKFVIWGADFEKQINPVWFRVLAGDLEDKTEDKGVYIINKDRFESSTSSTETTEETSNDKGEN